MGVKNWLGFAVEMGFGKLDVEQQRERELGFWWGRIMGEGGGRKGKKKRMGIWVNGGDEN
ncbi:conserved hypothetical protein [Ricinus communis]|uniref:Uncharacterized protein n=1 Tax=Ricinus communis TaxID=3988 RepID=B9RZB1_RICCO|nr:conserved hypothetical protein [Ricinus communis]